jgi:DNA-binding protein H-NS
VSTLQELLARKEALEQEIEQTKNRERADAIAKVRSLMSEYGLSVADLSVKAGRPAGKSSKSGNKVAAKFRNKDTGDSWSGRGLQPKWLKAALATGRKIEDFAV